MTFQEKYPKLFQFFAGYFPDADFEDLTDEEVVSNYLSDCYRSEISRKNLEMVKQDVDRLIADIKLYWEEIGSEANRHFDTMEEASQWLSLIKQELNKR